MDVFSSNAEETIKKTLCIESEVFAVKSESDLVKLFLLEECSTFIKKNGYSKVCLQFPDSMLEYSVQVALWLGKSTNEKVFILGDTTYGSCCVDEVAAEHVGGDVVVHMGHACLSPISRLPVFYVLPRADLVLPHFASAFANYSNQTEGTILLLYDVAYAHLVDDISEALSPFRSRVVISQLSIPGSESRCCGTTCEIRPDQGAHQVKLLGRMFCCQSPASVVYITHKQPQNLLNFALSFRDSKFFVYSKESESNSVDFNKTLRRRLFLVEKVKDAKTLGIIVGTLSVDKFLDAIERVKRLAAYRGKRCYVFSVGKPNPAKLANFPEIEVFVLVSCPESCLENEKEYMQPVVTLMEAELALNPNRVWGDNMSVDFRDLLEDGALYKPLPEGEEPLEADVSLITNKIRSDVVTSDGNADIGTELSVREHYQISLASSYSSGRSWKGLEQALGETPVSQATMGRSGIPIAYDKEGV